MRLAAAERAILRRAAPRDEHRREFDARNEHGTFIKQSPAVETSRSNALRVGEEKK